VVDPLVSVVTVCLDRPYLLRTRAIPSLLRQTYPGWELIVVGHRADGGATREVVESFHDDRMRYEEFDGPDGTAFLSPEASAAWVADALDRAETLVAGQLIAPLDDGDGFLPEHLRDCVTRFGHGEADLVYGPVMVNDAGTGALRSLAPPPSEEALSEPGVIGLSSVCYLATFAPVPYRGDDGAPAGPHHKWRSMLSAGARFTSLEGPQAERWGDPGIQLHISLPSLPPLEVVVRDVAEIVSTRWTSNSGPFCARLEAGVAAYLGVEHVVGAPSGDVALGMAFQAVRALRPDRDEVIVPSYTFPSTANAVIRAGLRPRFCDVEASSLCATVDTVSPLVSARTAAIVPVHAHGNPCDMPGFESLAAETGAMLVSDAAAALGATLEDRRIGGFGDIEVFSLASTKVLTAGEGGLLACHDAELAALLRRIGRYGLQSDYASDIVGINGRLAEFPAALALRSLPHLEQWLHDRRRAGERYVELLAGCPGISMPRARPPAVGTWKDVPLVADDPGTAVRLADRLARYGVQTRPYYRPLHRMAAFAPFAADAGVPVAHDLEGRVLCVPIFNDISDEAVTLVAEVVRETQARAPSPALGGTADQ
jgi:dTDP-4-amino-4,6-dideoxygalactose transaminase